MWTAAYDYTRSSGPTVNCRTVAIRHKTADYGYTRRRGTFFELDLFFIGSFIPGTLFDSGLQSVKFSNFHFFSVVSSPNLGQDPQYFKLCPV